MLEADPQVSAGSLDSIREFPRQGRRQVPERRTQAADEFRALADRRPIRPESAAAQLLLEQAVQLLQERGIAHALADVPEPGARAVGPVSFGMEQAQRGEGERRRLRGAERAAEGDAGRRPGSERSGDHGADRPILLGDEADVVDPRPGAGVRASGEADLELPGKLLNPGKRSGARDLSALRDAISGRRRGKR
jgi:hypothetical protein